jgi:hypothetical protein
MNKNLYAVLAVGSFLVFALATLYTLYQNAFCNQEGVDPKMLLATLGITIFFLQKLLIEELKAENQKLKEKITLLEKNNNQPPS